MNWSGLKRNETGRILKELRRKTEHFEGKKSFLPIAKRIEDKTPEMMDLGDLGRIVRG